MEEHANGMNKITNQQQVHFSMYSYSSCITIRTTVLVLCGIGKGNWIFKSLILVVNPWDCEHEPDPYPCVHIAFMNYK